LQLGVIGTEQYSDLSANIKRTNRLQHVNFTYVVNNDELVINTTDDTKVLENCILEISVAGIKDKQGNTQASPVTWTAFVDKNTLTWEVAEKSIVKNSLETATFDAIIFNRGGVVEKYTISNLPSWISASNIAGTLAPNSSVTIRFTIANSVNIGYYNEDLYLTGNMDFNEKLLLSVKVNGNAPSWSVDASKYEASMNIIGSVSVAGKTSADTEDKIAVFHADECRGVGYVKYISKTDQYLVMLDIYGNIDGEELSFKVYDASTGVIYSDVTPRITFNADDLKGSISAPIQIVTTNNIEQRINLAKGWNWVSYNVNSAMFIKPNTLFASMQASSGDQIKKDTAYLDYSNTAKSWVSGSKFIFDNKSMYKFYVDKANTLTLTGQKVDVASLEIDVKSGWNWISYPLTNQLLTNEAFIGLAGQNGDLVKSQHNFAVYDDLLGWVGSLEFLVPGEGYLLKSATAGSFKYPLVSSLKSEAADVVAEGSHQYSNNMSIIAQVKSDMPIGSNDVISAYAGGILRGTGKAVNVNGSTVFFLTINGDNTPDVFNFKIQDAITNNMYQIVENMVFEANKVAGTLDSPVILSMAEGQTSFNIIEVSTVSATPNPFAETIRFSLASVNDKLVSIEIYNELNQLMKTAVQINSSEYVWDGKSDAGSELTPGVYYARCSSNNNSEVIRLIKSH